MRQLSPLRFFASGADAALRERLGTQARAAAVGLYSWDGVLSRITAALPARQEVA